MTYVCGTVSKHARWGMREKEREGGRGTEEEGRHGGGERKREEGRKRRREGGRERGGQVQIVSENIDQRSSNPVLKESIHESVTSKYLSL